MSLLVQVILIPPKQIEKKRGYIKAMGVATAPVKDSQFCVRHSLMGPFPDAERVGFKKVPIAQWYNYRQSVAARPSVHMRFSPPVALVMSRTLTELLTSIIDLK